jgi:predicted MFS family arabinose efflux permease
MGVLGRFYLFRGLGLTWLYVPFQWFYLRAQGLSATELMGLNTVFCIAAVLFEVPTGALADRLGRRPVMAAGAAFSSLSCLVFLGFPGSLVWLAVANVLAALAMTCISGADSAYLFDYLIWRGEPGRYRWAESVSSAIRLGASAAGGLAATALVSHGLGLAGLYAATAMLTGASAALALTLPEPWRRRPLAGRDALRPIEPTVLEMIQHGRRAIALVGAQRELLMLLGVSAMLFPALRVGLFLDQPFVQRLGFDAASLGLVFGAKDLVAAAAAVATAGLIARVGETRLLAALPLITGAALALMSVASGRAAIALVLLPTVAFGVYSPLVRVFINRRVAESGDRATVLSIEGMARRFGFAIFSPLAGAAVDAWSLGTALAASAGWAAVSFGLVFLMPRRSRVGGRRPEAGGWRPGVGAPIAQPSSVSSVGSLVSSALGLAPSASTPGSTGASPSGAADCSVLRS